MARTVMAPTKGQLVSDETGEIIDFEGVTEVQMPEHKKKNLGMKAGLFHQRWGLADFRQLAKMKVTGQAWQVFFLIADRQDKEDELARISQKELATKLSVPASTISRSIASLLAAGMLLRVEQGVFRIHPVFAYRGGADKWELLTRARQQVEFLDEAEAQA